MPPLIDFVRSICDEIEVDVYSLYYPFERRSYRLFGAQIHSFDLGRHPRVLRKIYVARARKKIAQEHAARPYDLIHAIWADTPAELAAQISSDLNIPLITTFYAGEAVYIPEIEYGSLRTSRARAALHNVLAQSSVSTCGSQLLSNLIAQEINHVPSVIPFGLCDDNFSPATSKVTLAGSTKIISAASFSSVKGLDVLLEAFQRLIHQHPLFAEGLHWHVIGPDALDRNLRDGLSRKAGNLPITWHDGRPTWEMPDFYRAGDIALLGSWFESQCFAALEPAACGIPVTGTSVGVIPEMVSPDWTCPPGDPQALMNLLVHVLSNRSHWVEESKRQRNWVIDNATLKVAAGRFRNTYEKLANSRGHPSEPTTKRLVQSTE